jgi:signal peptidase I
MSERVFSLIFMLKRLLNRRSAWQLARPPVFGDISAEDDAGIEVHHLAAASRKHFWSEAGLLVRDLVFAFMLLALVMIFVVQPVKVEGTSMLPRLHDGERIFVNKLVYYHFPRLERFGYPKLERGDIAVFLFPDDPEKSYVKRIIGLPGETVEIRDGKTYINGQLLNEPYLDPQRNQERINLAPVIVKKHYYFVMGDNRDRSYDSRAWGLVPEGYIYGKALFRYYPFRAAGIIHHDAIYPTFAPSPATTIVSDDDGDETQ